MQASGNILRLRFRMKVGFDVDQRLVFAPGGRSVANVMRIRKFGLIVARLDEDIRKVD